MSRTDSFQDLFSDIPPEKNLEQANHNLKVAVHLNNTHKLNANDWVITVAYYSVVHFFEHYLKNCAPILKFKGKEARVSSLKEVISSLSDSANHQKHMIRQKVIEENFGQIGKEWKFLSKGSYNARYNCYSVSRDIANESIKNLSKIKEFFKTKAGSPSSY